MILHIVVEDELSDVIIKKIIEESNTKHNLEIRTIGKRGKGYIKKRVNEFNNQSNKLYFIILVDLDNDPCAPDLIHSWFKNPFRNNLIFRVAVREVEAWILSDIDGVSQFFNISKDYVYKEVSNPDLINDPKKKFLSIVSRSNRKSLINDVVKKVGSNIYQGGGYNTVLSEFVMNGWSLEKARSKSDSLNRAVLAIDYLLTGEFHS